MKTTVKDPIIKGKQKAKKKLKKLAKNIRLAKKLRKTVNISYPTKWKDKIHRGRLEGKLLYLREEARLLHVAYSLMKGNSYEQIETKAFWSVEWQKKMFITKLKKVQVEYFENEKGIPTT